MKTVPDELMKDLDSTSKRLRGVLRAHLAILIGQATEQPIT